jgi:hypothetical protein
MLPSTQPKQVPKFVGPPWAPANHEPLKPLSKSPIDESLRTLANGTGKPVNDARADFFCATWVLHFNPDGSKKERPGKGNGKGDQIFVGAEPLKEAPHGETHQSTHASA